MSWRSRLENTQNHAPEDLGMTDLAHQDVGKAMQYIQELEDALQGCTTRMHYKNHRKPYIRVEMSGSHCPIPTSPCIYSNTTEK